MYSINLLLQILLRSSTQAYNKFVNNTTRLYTLSRYVDTLK